MADVVANPKPPPTVVAYGPAHVVWNLLFGFVGEDGLDAGSFVALLIPIAVAFRIWKRSKAAWVIAILLAGLAVLLGIGHLAGESRTVGAIQVGGAAVMLGLLLAPRTRRWVA